METATPRRRPHRATGRPRGRPKVRPANFDEIILAALCRRMDPLTRKVIPRWQSLVSEFRMGKNTLGAAINSLKSKGLIKSVSDYSILGTNKLGTVYLIDERGCALWENHPNMSTNNEIN